MSPDLLPAIASFARVAHHGSFTRAAAELGVSTSALSQSLRALEARLGVRLLERSTRHVRPTEAGQRFLDEAGPGLASLAMAVEGLDESRRQPAGLLRLNVSQSAVRSVLQPHLAAFARSVEWDLRGRKLAMTDCWVNIMPHRAVHSLHLHPLSSVSGTYYVQVPAGTSGIKFEDPRLDRFMAAPPRKSSCKTPNRPWVTLAVAAGQVVLFESWLRHEVPANTRRQERVSISFNFNWF